MSASSRGAAASAGTGRVADDGARPARPARRTPGRSLIHCRATGPGDLKRGVVAVPALGDEQAEVQRRPLTRLAASAGPQSHRSSSGPASSTRIGVGGNRHAR